MAKHAQLIALAINDNRLTEIDLSENTLLDEVYLSNNKLINMPTGINNIVNTNVYIDLRENSFDDDTISKLEELKEAYRRLHIRD